MRLAENTRRERERDSGKRGKIKSKIKSSQPRKKKVDSNFFYAQAVPVFRRLALSCPQ